MEELTGKRRFRTDLPLTVSWNSDRVHRTASGTVVEIGSDGLLFFSETWLPSSAQATASIAWPVALDDGCPLQLVVMGPVLHSGAQGYRMRIDQYIFRTAARTVVMPQPAPHLVPENPPRNRFV